MYKEGEFIIYGNNGVCKVDSIGPIDCSGVSQDKIYYTLKPCYIKDCQVFVPIDNQRVVMRRVMTKEEATALVLDIPNIEDMGVIDEKRREKEYKEAVSTCDARELVKIIKTIYKRKNQRIAEGKKITSSDTKYFRIAEDSLYGELAVALNMDRDLVGEHIANCINELEEKND